MSNTLAANVKDGVGGACFPATAGRNMATGCNYTTHRKRLFAFPARSTHSALVEGTGWRRLLRTVLACSIFTLTNHRQALNQSTA